MTLHRRAFTLPEVLLAILLLAIGILGLAGTATALAVQATEARDRVDAAFLAGSVLDSLRGAPCASVASGAAARAGLRLTWTVRPVTRALAVHAVLDRTTRRGLVSHPFEALLPCDR